MTESRAGAAVHQARRDRTPVFARMYRTAIAVAALAAVGYEIADETTHNPAFSLAHYLSHFTVQSNLLVAAVLLASAVGDASSRPLAWLRGAGTVYLVVTGLVYAFVLAHSPLSMDGPWNNTVVHRVVPVAVLLDWLLFAPRIRIGFAAALGWLAYPLAFVVYTLVRGDITGFYPYSFLNPTRPGGYESVATWSAGLLVGTAALALVVAARTRPSRPGGDALTGRAHAAPPPSHRLDPPGEPGVPVDRPARLGLPLDSDVEPLQGAAALLAQVPDRRVETRRRHVTAPRPVGEREEHPVQPG
jgi:hypothetical protein